MKRPQAGRSDRDGLGSGNGCDSNPAAELRASRVSGRPGPAARERVCDVGKDSGPGEKLIRFKTSPTIYYLQKVYLKLNYTNKS